MSDLHDEEMINHFIQSHYPGCLFISVDESHWGELILPPPQQTKYKKIGLRVIAITSFLHGNEILRSLIGYESEHSEELNLVAVATDDAINAHAKIGLHKRFWKDYSTAERLEWEKTTIEMALQAGIPIYTGELKTTWFYTQLTDWRPDVIIVGGCGQIFDVAILRIPPYGVYNFHPSDLAQGYGAGLQYFDDLISRQASYTRWTVHQMIEEVDAGLVVGQSPPIFVANDQGTIPQDPKFFYEKLTGVVGPMVTILIEELVRYSHHHTHGWVGSIDFCSKL